MGLLFESATLDLIFLLGSLIGYLYYWYLKRQKYFVYAGLPYVKSNSLFEFNVGGAFQKVCVGETYDRLYKELEGHDYGGYFHILTPSLVLRDPELILDVLKSNFSSFNDHGLPIDPEVRFLDTNLFMTSGPKWKALRRKLSPTFTSGKLKGMFSLIDDCVENLIAHLDKHAETDFELKDILARFTTDVIGSCAFGIDSQSIKDPDSQFRQMGKRVFNTPFSEKIKLLGQLTVPGLLKALRINMDDKVISDFFSNLMSQTFEHRKRTGEKRNDFVDLLLQLKEKGSVDYDIADQDELESEISESDNTESIKLEFTDKLLTAQSFVFFVAGFETTASAISFTLYLLARHQEAQDKAREDIRKHKNSNGSFDYNSVKNMAYLDACFSESLRLYPPIQILPRSCTKEFRMKDGYVVKQGTRVIIPTFSLQRDPKYFKDPLSFCPERFLRGDPITPGTYMPFGDGPRVCIAKRFARLESVLVIAKILDRYLILPSPKMYEPLTLENNSFVVVPKGGTWIKFKKLP